MPLAYSTTSADTMCMTWATSLAERNHEPGMNTMTSQKEQVAYVEMRWNDAAMYSAKARELEDIAKWIADKTGTVDAALASEADRIESIAATIRVQCESLAGWPKWKAANIDAMDGLQNWFAAGAE